MHPDPRQMPNHSGPDVSTPDVSTPDVSTPDVSTPDVSTPDETLADETYTTFTREGADVPDLQPLFDDYTDQDETSEPRPDVDEEAQKGHS